jgi:predicted P-loop ATPase
MSAPDAKKHWRDLVRYNRNGNSILPDQANISCILRNHDELGGRLRYNAFAYQVEACGALPWNPTQSVRQLIDADTTAFLVWLQELGVDVRHEKVVNTAIDHAARQTTVHPVQDYLYNQKWDGKPRLATALLRIFNATGDEQYLREVFLRFMVSAVARVKDPGCKVDHMMVLEGPQGCGKSRAVQTLVPNPAWYTDGIPKLGSREAASHLQGIWILELPELAAMGGTTIEQTKAFLSRNPDRYRPWYGSRPINAKRQGVFIGTTNSTTYLSDSTGNRRFWPVRVGKIDIVALSVERSQLWAEAAHLYDNGERWHLSGGFAELAALEAEQRRIVSEVECQVTNYLLQRLADGCQSVSTEDIYRNALGLNRGSENYARLAGQYSHDVVNTLSRLSWTKGKSSGRGETRKNIYYPPS